MAYKRHRISFAWQNDGVSDKSHVAVRAYNFVGNTYRYDAFRGTGRSSQSRLSLNYDFQLFQRDKKTSVFISTSLGLCYRAGPKGIGPVGSIGSGGNLAPNKAITVNTSSFTDVAKYVVNFGAGIGVDLYAKKYYLFTLSANFTYSNSNLYFTERTVSVFNNTSTQDYNFKTKALCSGIYFGISRRFQFYPWKPIKDYPIWESISLL